MRYYYMRRRMRGCGHEVRPADALHGSREMRRSMLRLRTETHTLTLQPGQLLTRRAGIPHRVEAVERAAFLLTPATATPQPGES
jgi:hypothetical protein